MKTLSARLGSSPYFQKQKRGLSMCGLPHFQNTSLLHILSEQGFFYGPNAF